MDFIVNNDELAINCATSDSSPMPAQSPGNAPHPLGKENIYEGDLGLGGHELKSEPALWESSA